VHLWATCHRRAGEDRARRRKSLGHCGDSPSGPALRPTAVLAAGSSTGGSERRAYSRSAAHIRVDRNCAGSGIINDRQTSGPYAATNDCAIRSPRDRSSDRSSGTSFNAPG
jgi:hypothetical protein